MEKVNPFLESRSLLRLQKAMCSSCVEDYALKSFIEENGAQARCDYCHGDAKDIRVVESEALLEFIAEGLHSE